MAKIFLTNIDELTKNDHHTAKYTSFLEQQSSVLKNCEDSSLVNKSYPVEPKPG
jgi:hypothetical protein